MEHILQLLFEYIGEPAIIVIAIFLIDRFKNQANKESEEATNPKQKQMWHNAAVGLDALETVGKNRVALLDKDDAPNSDKQKQATRELQAFADSHNINVSTEYIHGLIEAQVNDLRAKQGMRQDQSNTTGQSVTVHKIPSEGGVNNG